MCVLCRGGIFCDEGVGAVLLQVWCDRSCVHCLLCGTAPAHRWALHLRWRLWRMHRISNATQACERFRAHATAVLQSDQCFQSL